MLSPNLRAMSKLRLPALTLTLCSGLLLGVCDGGDDDHDDHVECSAAQSERASDIAALTADQTTGAAVFAQTCGSAGCHGADGVAGSAPNLDDEIPEFDSESLSCLVLGGTGSMPSQASLSDQELADVLAYVQATF